VKPILALIALAAASLAGCSTGIYNPPPPARPAPQTGESASVPAERQPEAAPESGRGAELPPLPESPPVSSVAASLVIASRDQRNAGNLNGAAATIERGLTIAPDEAVLWVELAEIRLAQGDRTTAEEMARKALTLTNAGTPVYQRAQRVLRR
jgi:predicted Zn-dependent protease